MKPFNLESFKQGAVGITRGGDEVTFVAHVPDARTYYRLIYVDSNKFTESCAESGKYLEAIESEQDIIGLKQSTKTYWINLYEGSCYGYESKEYADEISFATNRINGKAYKVEIEL